jgi:hypothetical protein
LFEALIATFLIAIVLQFCHIPLHGTALRGKA